MTKCENDEQQSLTTGIERSVFRNMRARARFSRRQPTPLNEALFLIKKSDTSDSPHCESGVWESVHHYPFACPHCAGAGRLVQEKLRREVYSIPFMLNSHTGIPHFLRYISDASCFKATLGPEVRPADDFVIKEKQAKKSPRRDSCNHD